MARTKLKRIISADTFPNVFRVEGENIAGNIKEYLGNNNPVILEVGCGHGDYSISLALRNPDKNFIGIDLRVPRVITAARTALELGLKNIAFIIGRAENLADVFKSKDVEEIWIPFPEPHLKKYMEDKRLVSMKLLNTYKPILKSDGIIHLKTDNPGLYDYAINLFEKNYIKIYKASDDLHNSDIDGTAKIIKTKYEKAYMDEGRKIKYICFSLT